jgi:hypothetical protein
MPNARNGAATPQTAEQIFDEAVNPVNTVTTQQTENPYEDAETISFKEFKERIQNKYNGDLCLTEIKGGVMATCNGNIVAAISQKLDKSSATRVVEQLKGKVVQVRQPRWGKVGADLRPVLPVIFIDERSQLADF